MGVLNCKLMKFPFNYLGIPIVANPRKEEMWKPIIEKVKKKLSLWKHKLISFVGRVCLINSILNVLPLFFFSFFKIPMVVLSKLVSLQRNFLWGSESDNRKIAWVSLEKICLPKESGGLGIKDIRVFNEALLSKWRWLLFHQQDLL